MLGNVWEWTQDIYEGSSARVVRGGSWYYLASVCRSADRGNVGPGGRDSILGFRLARTK
jgi:formylglycine-generating enzyme required for sulfatase activity